MWNIYIVVAITKIDTDAVNSIAENTFKDLIYTRNDKIEWYKLTMHKRGLVNNFSAFRTLMTGIISRNKNENNNNNNNNNNDSNYQKWEKEKKKHFERFIICQNRWNEWVRWCWQCKKFLFFRKKKNLIMIWCQIVDWFNISILFRWYWRANDVKHQQILDVLTIWHQIMFSNDIRRQLVKFPFWKEQYWRLEKRRLKSAELWKSCWNWSFQYWWW